jgi:hypothetical protein
MRGDTRYAWLQGAALKADTRYSTRTAACIWHTHIAKNILKNTCCPAQYYLYFPTSVANIPVSLVVVSLVVVSLVVLLLLCMPLSQML